MTDEQRTDSLGCYGSPWAKTPNLDALARNGVLFRNAITPAPLCTPARCGLLTGQYPSETGVWSNHDQKSAALPFLTNVFVDAGYRTASFGKQHYDTVNAAFQHEEPIILSGVVDYFSYSDKYPMQKYDLVQYPGPKYQWIFGGRFPESIEQTSEYRAVERAKEWLANSPGDEPFLLHLSFNAPHTPVSVVPPFDRCIPQDSIHLPVEAETFPDYAPAALRALREFSRSDRLSPDQIRKVRQYYYGSVSFVDFLFGGFLDWMRERKLLENTIVAFVSDHGTHLGDFGMFQKQTYFNPAVNVPYFFWYPSGIKRGATINQPVSTTSLLPTLLEMAGLDIPKSCRERSLSNTIRTGREPKQRPVFSGHTLTSFGIDPREPNVMVRDGDWKMSMWQARGPCEKTLVNLARDPYERRNRVGDLGRRDVELRLTAMLENHLASGRAPDPGAS